jgi:outer membrane murein-binding lipoprotein Lpp
MQNRARNEQLIVRVTPEEKKLIQKKMGQYSTGNFSRYARKMLIDGYVINVDLSDFQRLSAEVNAVGTNINQIAKAVNATGRVYESDIAQAKERVEEKNKKCLNKTKYSTQSVMWQGVRAFCSRYAK